MRETESLTTPSSHNPVVVALGSNLSSRWGSPAATIQRAFDSLAVLTDSGLRRSSLWRTTPQDCPAGAADFINAIALFAVPARDTPRALFEKLQILEQDFGRIRDGRTNQARTLDLDLICFGDQCSNDPGLTLPHPRAHQRYFVLKPLAELAPDLILPGQCDSVSQLLEKLLYRGDSPSIIGKNVPNCD